MPIDPAGQPGSAEPASNRAFRERLRARELLMGTVISVADPALAELVAARFDFVWIDLEHSALTLRDVQSLAIAARAAQCAALVRLPEPDSEVLPAVLDIGVDGVVAPRVSGADQARRVVGRLRYPPAGSRGFAHRRASGYGSAAGPPSFAAVEPACLIQIESASALDSAAEIADVRGVDGLVVGTADLSHELGISAAVDASEMASAIHAVERAASAAGVASGFAAGGEASRLVRALGNNSTLLVYSADVRIYAHAVDRVAASLAAAVRAGDGPQTGKEALTRR